MGVPYLVIFHTIGTDPRRDHPTILVDVEMYFTIKCIPTNENAGGRLETFRSIPNTLQFFFFYDGTQHMKVYDRKGKGYVPVYINTYNDFVTRLLMGMTSFEELAKEYNTYGDDSDDEE
ncbi:hypothetical protein BGZ51_002840 [Haplosporangium sp. Z 767]|nr:hypothetical protein BGZ51_002840 [Haplosporangium sp. Z 767]